MYVYVYIYIYLYILDKDVDAETVFMYPELYAPFPTHIPLIQMNCFTLESEPEVDFH